MRIRLQTKIQRRNIPLPSGGVLGDALTSEISLEIETDEANLNRDIVTAMMKLGGVDVRVLGYQVWTLIGEQPWDRPFEPIDISPDRLAELRAIIDRTIDRTSV